MELLRFDETLADLERSTVDSIKGTQKVLRRREEKLARNPKTEIRSTEQTVVGFRVVDSQIVETDDYRRKKERVTILKAMAVNLLDAIRQLRGLLERNHIAPIAVIPEKIWDELVAVIGLYQFEEMRNGQADCRNVVTRSFLTLFMSILATISCAIPLALARLVFQLPIESWLLTATLIGTPAATILTNLVCPSLDDERPARNRWLTIATTLGTLFFPLAIIALQSLSYYPFYRDVGISSGYIVTPVLLFVAEVMLALKLVNAGETTWARLLARWFPSKVAISKLWPDRIDTGTLSVNVQFPDPPEEIGQVILKARQVIVQPAQGIQRAEHLRLSVAAEAEAITYFWGKPLKSALKAGAGNRDPVIYIRHNGVVAILAQFGSFPLEREVIERIKLTQIIPRE